MVKGSLIIDLFIEDLQGKFKKAHLTRQRFVDIHFTINHQSKPNSLKKSKHTEIDDKGADNSVDVHY